MESPPQYMPGPKKSNTGLIIGLVVGGVFLCCVIPVGFITLGGFWAFKKISGTASCVFTFSDMKRAVQLYEAEHNGKLPKAETWQDDLREDYRKSMTSKDQMGPFGQLSPEGDWGCKESDGTMTGMAFNSDLSGKDAKSIADQVNTVLIFETEHPSKNQHAHYTRLDPKASPRIFNKPRGWFLITVNGDVSTDTPEKGLQRIGTMPGGSGSGITIKTTGGD